MFARGNTGRFAGYEGAEAAWNTLIRKAMADKQRRAEYVKEPVLPNFGQPGWFARLGPDQSGYRLAAFMLLVFSAFMAFLIAGRLFLL